MILNLLWKEAREHFWKFLTLLIILLGSLSFTELPHIPLNFRDDWLAIWMIVAWLSPLWLAAYTITSEYTRRTSITLLALPVSRLLIFPIKSSFALATFMLPLTLCLMAGNGSIDRSEYHTCVQVLFALPALYFFILCIALNIRREGVAVMVGILILLLCAICGVFIESKLGRPTSDGPINRLTHPILFRVLSIPNPLGRLIVGTSYNYGPHWLVSPFVQLAVIVGYSLIAALRYVLLSPFPSQTPHSPSPVVPSTIRNLSLSPRRYPIIWKECREQFPILLLTAVVGMLLALFFAYIDNARAEYRPYPSLTYLRDTLQMFFVMGTYLAFAVGAILGLSATTTDMHSPVTAYWRATPIPPRRLFWTKLLVSFFGIVLLIAAFELPFAIADPILQARGIISGNQFDVSTFDMLLGHAVMLPLNLALATFFATLFRRTIYAAAATFLAIIIVTVFPLNDRFMTVGTVLYYRGGPVVGSSTLYLAIVVVLLAAIVTISLVARNIFSKPPATLST